MINLFRINLWLFFPILMTTAAEEWRYATENIAGDPGRTTVSAKAK